MLGESSYLHLRYTTTKSPRTNAKKTRHDSAGSLARARSIKILVAWGASLEKSMRSYYNQEWRQWCKISGRLQLLDFVNSARYRPQNKQDRPGFGAGGGGFVATTWNEFKLTVRHPVP